MARKSKEFTKLETKKIKRPGRVAKRPNKRYTKKKRRGQGKPS